MRRTEPARRSHVSALRRVIALTLVVAVGAVARADPLPQDTADKHLGVNECRSPLCHNAVTPWDGSRARLNEYRIWRDGDRHAQAFSRLKTPLGKRIGRNLGVIPVKASECLSCHTEDVSPARRGARYDLRDGVGCEACHGGAERWIESHKAGASHQDNVNRGMYRTEDPRARAELCLSCHLGTGRKVVTHRMLAAGHPRLSFELDTFTQLEPPHWVVNEHYVERKGKPVPNVQAWAIGQAVALREYLSLLSDSGSTREPWYEFAVFDCATCHHDLGTWMPGESGNRAPIGVPKLTDAPFVLYERVLTALQPSEAGSIRGQFIGLNRSVAERRPDVASRAASLRADVTKSLDVIARAKVDEERVLTALACDRPSGRLSYLVAEQLTMGIEATLASMRGENTPDQDPDVRRLLDATQNLGSFDPAKFRSALDAVCARRS